MMEVFNDHRKLYGLAAALFVFLTFFVAIVPALNNQRRNAPLPGTESMTGDALAGKRVFIANGCVSCHSQQVRNVEMDKAWGSRPNVAADYAHNRRMDWWMNTATLMGTERTGPDLTNIGARLPSADWHLLHLYNPRAVVQASIMPAYPWMFEWKEKVDDDDKVVQIPDVYRGGRKGHLVAREEALQLVAYLQTLKQTPLPDGTSAPEFLYKGKDQTSTSAEGDDFTLDGAQLYARQCQACHQANGEGLKGAFPPLKSSGIVLDDDPSLLVEIIMKGYDAREEYGAMPPIGAIGSLTAAEITAIINHERTNWGNDARKVSVDEVESILKLLKSESINQ
jgi:cytochrome c oxidase cbb3-type subunit 2